MDFKSILPDFQVEELIRTWLKEDIPNFDVAAIALSTGDKEGVITVKEDCVLAGCPFVTEIFEQLQCTVEWKYEEGTKITSTPSNIAVIRGPLKQVLRGERLALNILSRSCGIAKYARRLSDISTTNKWKGSVAGTRKTTPGFRLVEKYAMIVGGASPHRYDLSSLVMLKDNHIDSYALSKDADKEKAISLAVSQTRKIAGHHMKIEIEARTEKEAIAAASAGADIVMLDNFIARMACGVAQRLKSRFPKVIVEISGNVTESNISGYMTTHVDVISTSKLSNGYPVIDLSMKLQNPTTHSYTGDVNKSVCSGVKRPVSGAFGGKTVDNANDNKNGDSGVLVDIDAEVPDKRRKTEENVAKVEVKLNDSSICEEQTTAVQPDSHKTINVSVKPAADKPVTVPSKTGGSLPTKESLSNKSAPETSANVKSTPISSSTPINRNGPTRSSSSVTKDTGSSRPVPNQGTTVGKSTGVQNTSQPGRNVNQNYGSRDNQSSRNTSVGSTGSNTTGRNVNSSNSHPTGRSSIGSNSNPTGRNANNSNFNPSGRNVGGTNFNSTGRNVGGSNVNPAGRNVGSSSFNPSGRNAGSMNSGTRDQQPPRVFGTQNAVPRGNVPQGRGLINATTGLRDGSSQRSSNNQNRGNDNPNSQYSQVNRGPSQSNRFRGQNNESDSSQRRTQPNFPQSQHLVNRGVMSAFAGNPLHQQLALQVAATRATGVSLRPGSSILGSGQGMLGGMGVNRNFAPGAGRPNRGRW